MFKAYRPTHYHHPTPQLSPISRGSATNYVQPNALVVLITGMLIVQPETLHATNTNKVICLLQLSLYPMTISIPY